jgi:sugar transferase EpsL
LRTFLKRLLDVILSATGLIMLGPLLIFLAVMIRLKMGKPVLFRQQRPGLGGKGFVIYKFRTMTDKTDKSGQPLPDEKRLPALGRLLRSTSLDEFPEPLMMKYLDRYTPEQARRHEVKPGITGWAQINGRNAISWEDKFKLDVWYVDNWSVMLDLKIILKSIWMVITRQGITQQGRATVDEFMGTQQHKT